MIFDYKLLKEWYYGLPEQKRLRLWQNLSTFMNNNEIKNCIDEVNRGNSDLFDIHWKNGYIDKYQIYFNQIISKMDNKGE